MKGIVAMNEAHGIELQHITPLLNRIAEAKNYTNWSDQFARKYIVESFENMVAKEVKWEELINLPYEDLWTFGFRQFNDQLLLIPLWLFSAIPQGFRLTSISGREVEVGKDDIDLDTRAGCIAFGIKRSRD
jgi:hypothetical protein